MEHILIECHTCFFSVYLVMMMTKVRQMDLNKKIKCNTCTVSTVQEGEFGRKNISLKFIFRSVKSSHIITLKNSFCNFQG